MTVLQMLDYASHTFRESPLHGHGWSWLVHGFSGFSSSALPPRWMLNGIGFVCCVVVLVLAYYLQYAQRLPPCPLCTLQRAIMTILGIVFLIAAVHDPTHRGARVYAFSIAFLAGLGGGIAGYQVWLQSSVSEAAALCLPPLNYLLTHFSLSDTLDVILSNPASCSEVRWTLLGLSIPGWSLLAFVALGALGSARNSLRR